MRRDGEEVHLTPIEFELLRALARNRGRLMTHRALLIEVWGPGYADDTQVLRTHIANLRRKIEPPGDGGVRRSSAPIRASATASLPDWRVFTTILILAAARSPCGLDGRGRTMDTCFCLSHGSPPRRCCTGPRSTPGSPPARTRRRRPSSALRARQLCDLSTRRSIGRAVLAAPRARAARWSLTSAVPVSREALDEARPALSQLAIALSSPEPVRPQGVAQVARAAARRRRAAVRHDDGGSRAVLRRSPRPAGHAPVRAVHAVELVEHGRGLSAMDAISIALAVVTFALLYAAITFLDRV